MTKICHEEEIVSRLLHPFIFALYCEDTGSVTLDQSSGYDIYRHYVVLCIVVAMMSVDITHVVGIMPVGNADLYVVHARCSSYFRV
jgi:hypothetical protein